MNYLDGNDLYQMFQYGASFINKKRKLLNDINVFPVPDGDTGNNLAHTMQTITRDATLLSSFHHTLESISDSALVGARGNSGIIFAQFVNGLRLASKGQERVTMEEFALMANESVKHTYHSLENPVEGTMLTVIKSWASSLLNLHRISSSIKAFFFKAYAYASKALAKTKEQLAILKKRDVIDSGALGFVMFLEGINSYFNHEKLELNQVDDIDIPNNHEEDEAGEFRYCTEGLVSYQKIDEDTIIKALKPFGDSLIVAMGAKMFRIHIHTNQPVDVFEKLSSFGKIISQKVDDMMLDINMKHDPHDTVIVTDSISDIDPLFLAENHVRVLPVNVMVDDVNYFDKITINNKRLFELIESGVTYPTTATPTIGAIKDLFEKLIQHYKHILVLTVSKNLSATYNVVLQEAKRLNEDGKDIVVIDTMTNSSAQGLLVKRAVDLLNEKKSLKEIEHIINDEKKRSEILVCLETFKYATMSGRLPKAVGKIGMTFGIRPIMSIDEKGKGAAFAFALSQKGITKRIVKHVKRDIEKSGIERYALVHCLNEPLAQAYETLFTEIIGKKPEYIADVSSATAIHSGKGTVAIAYIKK